ncbi:MAG: 23S rRNA (adenine(2030)-N(6))-methyltransferase RlmJ [Rhodospirillaceae bacterium]
MNYRHLYHAGNAADVVKHAVLALLLERLGAKPAPFFVLDSHAGIGRYDLASEPAQRTGEAAGGIGRLLAVLAAGAPPPPELAGYLAAVAVLNGADEAAACGVRWYPGSPRLARALMRPGDRLVLAEAHPEDARTLKREFAGDRQVHVHHRDGWAALTAFLPPTERRGLVLIDPPYEAADEAARLVAGLAAAHRRWPTGIFALWYPIKERAWVWRLHEALVATGIGRQLMVELTVLPEDDWRRLNGCGMIVINPPWQLDGALTGLLPWLHHALAPGTGGSRVAWLVPEDSH